MKINLKQTLNNLKGEPLKDNEKLDLTLGEALANILLASEEKGKMKLFVLAKKFFEQETVDLDASDFALVNKVVSESKAYNSALVTGQIELLLSEVK